MIISSIRLLFYFIGILLSSLPALAEIKFPTPEIVSIEKTEYADPKTVAAKRATGKFIFTQYTNDYNEQFKKDNQFSKDVISTEILSEVLLRIDGLNETELDKPIAVHIKNAKANYDVIAQQVYDQGIQLIDPNTETNEIKAENSAVASRFRGLEIFFAVIVVVLASLLYKKTFKLLDKNDN